MKRSLQPEALDRICRAARSTARLFRLEQDAHADGTLVQLIDGLVDTLRDASFEDADEIGRVLAQAVRAQECGEPLRVADLLEFELLPRLEQAADQASA